LDPLEDRRAFERIAGEVDHDILAPVYETIRLVRSKLDPGVALLGFCGAPWTVATYMIAGRGTADQAPARLFGYRDRVGMDTLIDVLVEASASYLVRQLQAGADAVQIFDSWASGLTTPAFARWVVAPTRKIVNQIRAVHPTAKIIGFPRASTLAGYELYARETGVDAISLDTSAPLSWARDNLSNRVALQGNLDPIALIAGGKALDESVDEILSAMKGARFIFNLGHGILQETPIAHVEQLIARVRSGG
jgi:uroporphyrinogen decarboxylase